MDAETLHEWAAAHNLNEIIHFYNVTRACLAEQAAAFAGDAIQDRMACASLTNYQESLAKVTFLMVYAYFEEDLYLLWQRRARDVQRGRGSSIARYEPILERFGTDLRHSSWQFMLEATEVRHILIHANGRIDHSRNRAKLDAIIDKHPDELSVLHSRLRVGPTYVSRAVAQVRAFQDEIRRPSEQLEPEM